MSTVKFKFEQGEKVMDMVTRFGGLVTARVECSDWCLRYEVTPKGLKDGIPIAPRWVDETQLKSLEKPKIKINTRTTGGPHNSPRPRSSTITGR